MDSQRVPKIDGLSLEFTIEIQDAQFNHGGLYYLDLSIQNSHTKDFSNVMLKTGNDGPFVIQRQVRTQVLKQEENTPFTSFRDKTDKKFTFRLPKGFCKNDKNHEVYLLLEAFSVSDFSSRGGRKMGEGKFAIYPRTNAPKINLYVDPGEDYYSYTGIISLLRTHSTDNIQMHCGRIRSTYSLREVIPERSLTPQTPPRPIQKPPKPVQRPPTPRTPTPTPRRQPTPPRPRRYPEEAPPQTAASSWGEDLSLNLPATPPLPPAADGRKLPEIPLKDNDRHTFAVDRSYCHVAEGGKQQIDVIVHGATSLPQTPDGRVPQPYTVIKTKSDDDRELYTGAPTHAAMRSTHAPNWEELISIGVDEDKVDDEMLVVNVGDALTQKGLVNYKMPISSLSPFHQYHLELNMPAQGIPSGVRTFATITRKLNRLPRDPACPNYLGLEVLLRAVQRPIQSPLGPLIAVARIVPDYYNYKSNNLQNHPRNAGVTMQNVTFPSPHPSSFIVTQRDFHGHPQLSLPGRPDEQPVWNHPYLFVEERDKATLFTPGAALIIEYYVVTMAMTDQFWRMQSPVAFSALQMDQEMYKELMAPRAVHGLRLEGLPVQGSDMVTANGGQPTVGMILRLITEERPDCMVAVSNYDDLPVLDMFPSEVPNYYRGDSPDILKVQSQSSQPPDATSLISRPRTPPEISPPHSPSPPPQSPGRQGEYILQRVRKKNREPLQDGEFPPYSAVEEVLPEYQYIFSDPDGGKKSPKRATVPRPGPSDEKPETPYGHDDLDRAAMDLVDHQSRDLKRYHEATNRMGQDILSLRNQVRELEAVNSKLRLDMAHFNDTRHLMMESAELDGLPKHELLAKYGVIKGTLSTQTNDLKTYKVKVQELQNELIKKNDKEKEYLRIQKAHASQQALIQQLQDKLKKQKKLEETCKQQENVIQRMEQVLARQQKDRSKQQKDKTSQDANGILMDENRRLRQQIEDLKSQRNVGGSSETDDQDRLEMYQTVEKAQGRIASLEKQLMENARQWGREREDMNLRLNEAEHNFGRSNGVVLHDYNYPLYNVRELGASNASLKRLSPMRR